MSGHNGSLGHDYIHSLGEYYACRCPQDEVDRPQQFFSSLLGHVQLRGVRWYPKTRQLAKRESSS